MVELTVIEGGREQMAQEALSAVLTRNDVKYAELLRIMQPRIPLVSVISGAHTTTLTQHSAPDSNADKT